MYHEISDLPLFDTVNSARTLGGLKPVCTIIRAENIVSFPSLVGQSYVGDLVVSKQTNIYVKDKAFGLAVTEQKTTNGSLHRYTVSGFHKRLREDLVSTLGKLTKGQFVLLVEDYNDTKYILGTPDSPMLVTTKQQTDSQTKGLNKADLRFSGLSHYLYPVFTGTIQIAPIATISTQFNPVNGEFNMALVATDGGDPLGSGNWEIEVYAKDSVSSPYPLLIAKFGSTIVGGGTDISNAANITDSLGTYAAEIAAFTNAASRVLGNWIFNKHDWAEYKGKLYEPATDVYNHAQILEIRFRVQNASSIWSAWANLDLKRPISAFCSACRVDILNGNEYSLRSVTVNGNTDNFPVVANFQATENGTLLPPPTTPADDDARWAATVAQENTFIVEGIRDNGLYSYISQKHKDNTGLFAVRVLGITQPASLENTAYQVQIDLATVKYGPNSSPDDDWEEDKVDAVLSVSNDSGFCHSQPLNYNNTGTEATSIAFVLLPSVGKYKCKVLMKSSYQEVRQEFELLLVHVY